MNKVLGHLIRKIRQSKCLKLRDISKKKTGYAIGYLSEVERGVKHPKLSVLCIIANAMNVSRIEFLRMIAEELESNPD